ncbi:het domain [Trichoderma arundinaceum]|uniref:Het domain n=1 Tax=Trichoderma arundinaceum TaxID=490622 RepID=A0A395NX42_TRIAR|nr:het domain [Trichoderma arundinaceum]
MPSLRVKAADMAKKVAHEKQNNRKWATTPLEADYAVDTNHNEWVHNNIVEVRQDRDEEDNDRPDMRTRVTVKLAEGTHMDGIMAGVIDHHLLIHSEPAQPAAVREWHATKSVDIVEDSRGTCNVSVESGEFSWAFTKEEGFFYVPDELLQVVEVTDMLIVEAYGRSLFSRNTLPTSFRTLDGKMPKAWATSNVVPDELYGCYAEGSDKVLLGAFGLAIFNACEVTDPVGWEVEQISVSTSDGDTRGRNSQTQDDAPTWQFTRNLLAYKDCRCVGKEGECTSGKHVYDHETNSVRAMKLGESYVALSYVWAEAKDGTLQRAVQRMCEETKVTVFWIDQFCINQRCLTHKEEQIPQMGEIYSNAAYVACLLPHVSAVLPADVREATMVMHRQKFSQATATFRAQVKASAWFTRVWTWQEGLLAYSSKFVTSNDILEGWLVDNILNATRLGRCGYVSHLPALPASTNVQSLSVTVSSDTQLLPMRTASDAASRELRARWGVSRTFTLMGAVMATRKRMATVELDQLYGLLGMVDGGERMTVRYTSTMEDLLTEALQNGMVTAELLAGVTNCDTKGRCWLPNMRHTSHFAAGLGRLNRAGRKVEGNSEGMATVTGYTMPSSSVWAYDDSSVDIRFVLKSPEGETLASSNDEMLRQLLGTPVQVVLLDDVLSPDSYATCAIMVGAWNSFHRITSIRMLIEGQGIHSMMEEAHVIGCRLEE